LVAALAVLRCFDVQTLIGNCFSQLAFVHMPADIEQEARPQSWRRDEAMSVS
jgi:hypothetical protein